MKGQRNGHLILGGCLGFRNEEVTFAKRRTGKRCELLLGDLFLTKTCQVFQQHRCLKTPTYAFNSNCCILTLTISRDAEDSALCGACSVSFFMFNLFCNVNHVLYHI
ncbi:unnamed protein product [Ixodes pacificus]